MLDEIRSLPASANLVLVAANPKAGRGAGREALTAFTSALRTDGLRVEVIEDLKILEGRVGETLSHGLRRAVVAAGGDGTVAEVVNRTPIGTPIAVFPLGTENLLAKYLQCLQPPEELARIVADGAFVRMDAALAGQRIFLLMAGIGFDADVVHRLHVSRRGNIRHWTYIKPILDSLRSYEYPELTLYCQTLGHDGSCSEQTVRARWAFVTNLPCYAGQLPLSTEAVGTDGLLDLCSFQRGTHWHGFRYLAFVLLRQHRWLSDCTTGRLQRVRIEADRPVPYQLDGDPGGFLPVEIEVLPNRLTLIVSKQWAERSGFKPESSS